MSSDGLRLRPSARLQRYLGQELIADPNLAVIEFVKNAYDAGADRVDVVFRLTGRQSTLFIVDNGVGMNWNSFQSDWMRPGFSRKSSDAHPSLWLSPPHTAAGRQQETRLPLGEKGIGRFAAGGLGEILEVFTRTTTQERWLHVTFDWSEFEDMTKSMDEIIIPFDWQAPPNEFEASVGTVIVIRQLRLKWDGRVPGRPAPGRSRTRLGRLKQDLELLLRPLDDASPEFEVSLHSDSVVEAGDVGVVTPRSAQRSADYRYEFRLYVEGDQTVVERHLARAPGIAEEFGEPLSTHFEKRIIGPKEAKRAERPQELDCGEFSGIFFYDPPPRAKRATKLTAVNHGVLLYRDGALVEPYGLDANDWLGVKARKAQRQGHALVQPNTFSGEIRIGRESNHNLRDMANRQGLIDNDPANQFIAHVQAEFRFFEAAITPELEKRWTQQPEKAAESAEQRLKLATIRMKSVAHSLRQPLQGLRIEVEILNKLMSGGDLPDGLRGQISQVINSAMQYINRSEKLLTRMANARIPTFGKTTACRLLEAAADEVADVATHSEVELSVLCATERSLILPLELMADALAELLRNAFESPRTNGGGSVRMTATDLGSHDVRIAIQDDGTGLTGVQPETPLAEIPLETKGRPSGGLLTVVDCVALVKGQVQLVENGPDGATFAVLLPGRLKGLGQPT